MSKESDYFFSPSTTTRNKKNFEEDLHSLINLLRQKPKEYVKNYIKNNPNIDDEKMRYFLPLLNSNVGTNTLLLSEFMCLIAKDNLKNIMKGVEEDNPQNLDFIKNKCGKSYSIYHKIREKNKRNPADFLNQILLDKNNADNLLNCGYKFMGIGVEFLNDILYCIINLYEKNLIQNDSIITDKNADEEEQQKELRRGKMLRSRPQTKPYNEFNKIKAPIDFRGKNIYECPYGIKASDIRNSKKEIAFISRRGIKVPFGANFVQLEVTPLNEVNKRMWNEIDEYNERIEQREKEEEKNHQRKGKNEIKNDKNQITKKEDNVEEDSKNNEKLTNTNKETESIQKEEKIEEPIIKDNSIKEKVTFNPNLRRDFEIRVLQEGEDEEARIQEIKELASSKENTVENILGNDTPANIADRKEEPLYSLDEPNSEIQKYNPNEIGSIENIQTKENKEEEEEINAEEIKEKKKKEREEKRKWKNERENSTFRLTEKICYEDGTATKKSLGLKRYPK